MGRPIHWVAAGDRRLGPRILGPEKGEYMKVGKKLLLLAALAAFAMLVIGGTAAAHDDPLHPGHAACTWTVDKTASLHGTQISDLDLALNETVRVDYSIVVTRTCEAGFDPFQEGGSADVVDSYAGGLATHLFLDNSHDLVVSRTFTYSREITATSCDAFDVENTVEVLDGDPLNPFATDSVTIHVTVHCNGGCTLTQGYWKTHSVLGPASKADPTWNLVGGPNTTFFLSGQSWYQVFWTAPAGNVYYQLAHQYMAARLNILNGASAPASVTSAIIAATNFFNTYTPAQAAAFAKSSAARANALSLASTLGSYNEGAIGPGHCDE
jgi:hypothetical protein